jgi:Lon protease-like protein
MDLPVFALHAVTFPGERLHLRVFEARYLAMMRDVLPDGPFVVVAIRRGQEVGGAYEAHRVGVRVAIVEHAVDAEGEGYHLDLVAGERVALVASLAQAPYPRWHVEPFPDEGGAGTDALTRARAAFDRFLDAAGEGDMTPVVPREPVAASYALAAAAPGLPGARQALLEVAGAGERLALLTELFRREAALIRALGAGVAGAGLDVSPN